MNTRFMSLLFSYEFLFYFLINFLIIISCFLELHVGLFWLYFTLLQMLSSKDINFVGYTYKNFEIVNDQPVPGIGNYLPSFLNMYYYIFSVSSF